MLDTADPKWFFMASAIAVVGAVLMIFGFVFWTALPAFQHAGPDFFLSTTWEYDTRQYGALTLIASTFFLTAMTIALATPLGVFTAIYLAEYAPARVEQVLRPLIELLVGIPSVVYGIFGFLVLDQIFHHTLKPLIGSVLGFIPLFENVTPGTGAGYLLASVILTIMVLPTIVALTQESLRGLPDGYREASFALGATRWETIRYVLIPAASSGIITAVVLGVMRAMGETMAVVMLIGGSMHMPQSILDTGMVMTTRIVADSGYYLVLPEPRAALFALAGTLFLMEILFVGLIRLASRPAPGSKVQ